MFRIISDFLSSWAYESEATLKTFRDLTDESLNQRVTPDGRSLGFLAWHITTAISDMATQAGLPVRVTRENDSMPASVSAITTVYDAAAKAMAAAVKDNWSDSQLPEEIPMYGEKWTRGGTLVALIGHQCHHRGQMTVLMRQAGLKVPGVYGPSKEEWSAFGMQAQA